MNMIRRLFKVDLEVTSKNVQPRKANTAVLKLQPSLNVMRKNRLDQSKASLRQLPADKSHILSSHATMHSEALSNLLSRLPN